MCSHSPRLNPSSAEKIRKQSCLPLFNCPLPINSYSRSGNSRNGQRLPVGFPHFNGSATSTRNFAGMSPAWAVNASEMRAIDAMSGFFTGSSRDSGDFSEFTVEILGESIQIGTSNPVFTSHVERSSLSMRTSIRRIAWLTIAHSKKWRTSGGYRLWFA